jgi:hypothetical protein
MGIKHDAPESIYANEQVDDIEQNRPTAERDGLLIPDRDERGYVIREEPYGTKRRVKVILMGAGASTLNFLKKAEEQMSNLDITVYEKNHDVGGTWLENRYPGCACDIPSVNYQVQTMRVRQATAVLTVRNSLVGRSSRGLTSIRTRLKSGSISRVSTTRATSSTSTSNCGILFNTLNGTKTKADGC